MPQIQITDTYPLMSTTKGGTCSFCNVRQLADPESPTGLESVVHLGVWIEMEGALVICRSCAIAIGRSVDMLLESEAKARKSDVNRAEKRDRAIRELQPALLEAKAAIDEMVEAFSWE